MLLNCGAGEDSWESLGLQGKSSQSILKEICPECPLEELMLKLKLQYFGHLSEELTHWERPWWWERLKVGGEEYRREWDGWMASPTLWTWVLASSGSWWRTGKPGVLQSVESQRVGHNWTELTANLQCCDSFRWTAKGLSHTYTCIHSPSNSLWIVVQLLSCVRLFATPWAAEHQASLSFTVSQSVLKLMSIEAVMLSNPLTLYHPLLPPSIFSSISVFSNESTLHIRWPKYWSFSFSISPFNEYSGLISFRID